MIKERLDFSIRPATWFTFAVAVICIPLSLCAPETWAYENGLLENLQMMFLMLGIIFCVTARTDKPLYLFFATIIFFFMLREVNCGRMIFWSRSGEIFYSGMPTDYLKWKEIPHGSLIRTGIYIAITSLCILAWCRKGNFTALKKTLLNTKAPFWELLLLICGFLCTFITERLHLCFITEEIGELLLYTALTAAVFRYSRAYQPQIHP